MRKALISDIHGNLAALKAVVADIDQQDVSETLCLGDIIGYGPNPCECLDLVMAKCRLTILGNHDQAALFAPDGFNPVALRAIMWTREQLENTGASNVIDGRWDFLGELPRRCDETCANAGLAVGLVYEQHIVLQIAVFVVQVSGHQHVDGVAD